VGKIIWAAWIFLILMLFAVLIYHHNSSWQRYENNRLGFFIEYPKDWMVLNDDDSSVLISNTPGDKWAHGVGIPGISGGMWVFIRPDPFCRDSDYESDFDSDFAFDKFFCEDGFSLNLGFVQNDNPNSQKKTLKDIANSFQVIPRR